MGKLTKPGLSWQWLSSAVSARIAVKRGAGGSAADRSRASGRPLPDVRSYHPVSTAVPSGFDVPWLPVSHHPEERGFASLAPIISFKLKVLHTGQCTVIYSTFHQTTYECTYICYKHGWFNTAIFYCDNTDANPAWHEVA